jgi:hypothetical protein
LENGWKQTTFKTALECPIFSKLNWNKSPIEYLQTGQHVPNTKTAMTSVIS